MRPKGAIAAPRNLVLAHLKIVEYFTRESYGVL